MLLATVAKIESEIEKAVFHFWDTRSRQENKQTARQASDQGNRSAVTGGKQLDGFLNLLAQLAIKAGVPETCIHLKGNHLPGFFRPTKDWDLLIITPKGKLIAVIELKSQVGSFGNNFNNRAEEALGSAVDLWTAFRENAFPNQLAPWLGYLMIVEKSEKSTSPVRVNEPHFEAFPEFREQSYLGRYELLIRKLILERHYTSAGLLWTQSDKSFGSVAEDLSIQHFLDGFVSHIKANKNHF